MHPVLNHMLSRLRTPMRYTNEEPGDSLESQVDRDETYDTEPEEEETPTYECPNCGNTDEDPDVFFHSDRNRRSGGEIEGCTDCSSRCEHCGEVTDNDELSTTHEMSWSTGRRQRVDHSYCPDCMDSYTFQCGHCNDNFVEGELWGTESGTGDNICNNCSDEYFLCGNCDNVYHNNEYGGDGMCTSCQDEQESDLIHEYGWDPTDIGEQWYKHGKGKHFGMELETATPSRSLSDTAESTLDMLEYYNNAPYAFLTKDSSIKGPGFEITTHPATRPIHEEMMEHFLDNLPKGLKSDYDKYNCGLHIHINKDKLNPLTVFKLNTFINAREHREFMKELAGRESDYAKFHDLAETGGNTVRGLDRKTRREALNLEPRPTVEIRMFKGSTDKDFVLRALEFADAATEFAKPGNSGIMDMRNIEAFCKFVLSMPKNFPRLAKFCTDYLRDARGEEYLYRTFGIAPKGKAKKPPNPPNPSQYERKPVYYVRSYLETARRVLTLQYAPIRV